MVKGLEFLTIANFIFEAASHDLLANVFDASYKKGFQLVLLRNLTGVLHDDFSFRFFFLLNDNL
jgi:hypothetical protein